MAQAGHTIVLGSRYAISPPAWLPQADVVQMLWDDAEMLKRVCHGIDVVVQAAGMNAQGCTADPVAAMAFNGLATARLVEAAGRSRVERFVYLSTAHVYASTLAGTIIEETCPRNLHPYAISHLAGEHAVLCADQCGCIQGAVLRLSNAFGAPVRKEADCWMLLFNDLCRQVVTSGRIVLRSDGLQHRDFVPITDVCNAIDHVLRLPCDKFSGQTYNVGGDWSPSVFDVASLIAERYGDIAGVYPVISRLDPEGHLHAGLHYSTERLSDTGFRLTCDRIDELDELIRFCETSFGGG
jgi:UDP-glucose 4-epimerase